MTESIIVALVSAGLGLMGVIFRVVMSARKEETDRHADLDANIAEIMHSNEAHREQADQISDDLTRHMGETRSANEANAEAHTVLFTKLGRIEGWIEGRREAK